MTEERLSTSPPPLTFPATDPLKISGLQGSAYEQFSCTVFSP